MTPEQEKELQELFTKYGHPSTESDERIYIYLNSNKNKFILCNIGQ